MSRLSGFVAILCVFGQLYFLVNGSPYVVSFEEDQSNAVTTSRPLLGRRACTRGPAYWCYNITQAKECGAVPHCIKKVWEPMKLPSDNDSVCEVCKEMVKEARDQLLSNETQDELRQVLEGSCKLIPLKIISSECCKLADDFIPELVDTLASRMDPQVVCAVSGLCNSVRIDEMLGEMKDVDTKLESEKFDLDKDSCPKCSHYVNQAISSIKILSKDQLQMRLFEICGHLGSYSDSCRGIVMKEIDTVYTHIQTALNAEEVCGLIGLCEVVAIHPVKLQSSATYARVWKPPTADFQCDFCKQLVIYLKNWFTSGTTKEEFQKVIEGLCKQTGQYKDECLNLANQYGHEVYDYIVNSLNPEEACEFIQSCNATVAGRVKLFSSATNPSPVWTILGSGSPLTKLVPAEKMTGDDEKNSHRPGFTYPMMELEPSEMLTGDDERNAHKSNPEYCELCKVLAAETRKYVRDNENATDEEVEKFLNKLCDALTPLKGKVCHEIINRYGTVFVQAIISELDPEKACPDLGLCPRPSDSEMDTISTVPKKYEDILPTCGICTFTVAKLFDMIGKNRSKEAIDAAMENVCYIIPEHYKHDCLTFMKEYGEKVAEMIVIEGTAHGVCTLLHMCLFSPEDIDSVESQESIKLTGESMLPFDRYIPQTIVNEDIRNMKIDGEIVKEKPLCAICEFALTQIDNMLGTNATEEEIIQTVEGICKRLPGTLKDQCDSFIDAYGDMIVQYLVQQLDPRQVCSELELCATVQIVETYVLTYDKVDKCELCMLISDYLSAFLADPKFEGNIEKLVENICPLLPASRKQECKDLIEDYGAYLLSLLAQETDKGKVCAAINLCTA